MRPRAIIEQLDLLRPIYRETAAYGHFGRKNFPWEKTNRAKQMAKDLLSGKGSKKVATKAPVEIDEEEEAPAPKKGRASKAAPAPVAPAASAKGRGRGKAAVAAAQAP